MQLKFKTFLTTLFKNNNYFGGALSKGFATLRNVSKLHPNVPKLLRNYFEFFDLFLVLFILLVKEKYWLQKYFTENIDAIWASSFQLRAKIEIQEQFSVRLSLRRRVCFMPRDMFPQSAFQFGFLLSKPCLFPLKSSLEFVSHRGKPKFISLPVKFPADRSKFHFCTTARSIIISTRTALPCLCFFFLNPTVEIMLNMLFNTIWK